MDSQDFPKVKNVVKKWTKNGQRYLLHDRDLSGKDIYITIPITDTDTTKDYFRKIEEAKRKLTDKKLGSSIYILVHEYFTARQFSKNTMINQRFLTGFCFNDRINKSLINDIVNNDSINSRTKNMRIAQAGRFFRWLIDVKGINVTNPTIGICVKQTASRRTRCITNDEIKILFGMFKNRPELRLVIRLAFFTGARISSIYALRPDSLQNGYIYYDNVKCKKRYDYPIPLNDNETIELYHIVAQKGFMWTKTLNALKVNIDASMRRKFGKDINGESLSIHSLRHSFATRAIQNGVPPEIVSKMLDHSSISTTLTYYAKHSQQQIDDAMTKIFEKQKNPES